MRKLAVLILLLGPALHALAADQVIVQVTVEELENKVATNHGKSDEHVARELSELALTERLSTIRWSRLSAALPGEESREALIAVADAAAFLDLPASDIPATPAPDRAAQQALLEKAADYVRKTIPKLPDFFATQETTRFSDGPLKTSRLTGAGSYSKRLHIVERSSATVRVLAGREELSDERATGQGPLPAGQQLMVEGVFGPILKVVLKDVLSGAPLWSHWELGTTGPMAVYRYDVPQDKSHYAVGNPGPSGFLPIDAAYHGEIALDPGTGAILRLTLFAVPLPRSAVARADILVDYGPVKIGDGTYICPLRSVALSSAGNFDLLQDVYRFSRPDHPTAPSQLRLQLNDVVYSQYHLFRSDAHIITGDGAKPSENPPVPAPVRRPPASPAPGPTH